VLDGAVLIAPEAASALAPLKPGDGLVFDAADWRSPEQPEEGGRIYEVHARGALLELRFGRDAIRFERIRAGDLVWRTDDPELERMTRAFTQAAAPVQRQAVRVRATAQAGQPLALEWQLVRRPEVRAVVVSEQPLGRADRRALDEGMLREQLGRLGGTAYELAELDAEIAGQPFAPASLLNQLRRQAVEELERLQGAPPPIAVHPARAALASFEAAPASLAPELGQAGAQLHVLVRTPAQLEAAVAGQPASITLDDLELYGLRPAVEQVQAAGIAARVASPRVLKPSEQRIVRFLLKLNCAILVRSSGLLQALRTEAHPELVGDFSLNAANALTAETFLALGLARITPTHDLNAAQIAELVRAVGPERVELIGYQHLPVFHTEHCVFCRFLSEGTSYKDCGHPCEQHRIALRDVHGRAHPVMADVGCRNTVFGAEAQEASAHLELWRAAGARHLRLEFVHESGEQARAVIRAWQRALAGQIAPGELGTQLRRLAPQSTTEGSLFVPGGDSAATVIPLHQGDLQHDQR
jgi:putative protease